VFAIGSFPAIDPRMQPAIKRMNVLGVGVSIEDIEKATNAILEVAERNERAYVVFLAVHGIMEAYRDAALRRIFNRALLCNPDGMPLTWIGRLQGFGDIRRVYGPDLMLRVCERSQNQPWRHFLFGGKPGVAEKLQQNLQARFPGIQIAGIYTPPFRPLDKEDWRDLTAQVEDARPHFFWVGISTPKQEKFMAEALRRELPCNVLLGVGAAFDFHSGCVQQAPRWMMRAGLEWFFRLMQEPRRLWRRYLILNPWFVWLFFLQRTGLRSFPLGKN
jgi:N-acetylglucosaminyldiphosphoundecaprenol N-acetyl-beta-D-mannosaminyltransferase